MHLKLKYVVGCATRNTFEFSNALRVTQLATYFEIEIFCELYNPQCIRIFECIAGYTICNSLKKISIVVCTTRNNEGA